MLGGVGVQMREMRTEGMMVSTLRWDEDQESRLKTSCPDEDEKEIVVTTDGDAEQRRV